MKKILKSFKRAFLLEEEKEVLKNQCAVKPQAESNSEPEEQNKTAAVVSVATNQCQNDIQAVNFKAAPVTPEPEAKVQADKAKRSFQTQSHLYRETKNWNDCRLFLGGFPDNITESEVMRVFEKYGKVVDVMIPLEKDTNKSKKYGYLEFENKDSAQACLNDHFVTLCGKKVEVKKAWPRRYLRKEENCNKKETKETVKLPSRPKDLETAETLIDSCLGSSCTGSESNVEDSQLLYQELFKDYFKAKFFLQNLLGVEEVSNAPLSEEINKQQEISEAEMEKILRGLYVYTEGESSTGEDSEDFPSDSDGTYSIADELKFDLTENDEAVRPDQTENTPFLVKGGEGRVCELCKWAPSDNSIESFLAHCETVAHKQRLKERFKKSETSDQIKNKTVTQEGPKKNNRKKNKPQRTRQRKRKAKNKVMENQESQENKNKKLVLEEIIASVEAKTEKCIKCKMCNKTIPQAPNIRVLMSNLSHHLQSKGHLAKSFEKLKTKPEGPEKTQKTLKNAQKKNFIETTKSESCRNSKCTNPGVADKSKSIPEPHKSTEKVRFRCLSCSYFCSKPTTLLAHLNSESHSANDKRRLQNLL